MKASNIYKSSVSKSYWNGGFPATARQRWRFRPDKIDVLGIAIVMASTDIKDFLGITLDAPAEFIGRMGVLSSHLDALPPAVAILCVCVVFCSTPPVCAPCRISPTRSMRQVACCFFAGRPRSQRA